MNLQPIIYYVVYPMLSLAFLLGFIRLVVGPSLPDRIVAFEVVSISSASIIVVSAIATHQSVLLDVATGWAIVSFLSVIGFAYYIEKWRGRP
jgi:multicomponent Na+:H+ antiporter subunit F